MYDPYGGVPRREDLDERDTTYPPAARSEFDLCPTFMSFREIVLSKQSLNAQHPLASETSVKRWAKRALLRHTPASNGGGGGGAGLSLRTDSAPCIALRPLLSSISPSGGSSCPSPQAAARTTVTSGEKAIDSSSSGPAAMMTTTTGRQKGAREYILCPRDNPYYAELVARVAQERASAAAVAGGAHEKANRNPHRSTGSNQTVARGHDVKRRQPQQPQ